MKYYKKITNIFNLQTYLEEYFEKALETDFKKGISSDPLDLKLREEEFGHNHKKPPDLEGINDILLFLVKLHKNQGFWSLLWSALGDFTLQILIVCAIISIIVEVSIAENSEIRSIAWIDGFAILIAVFICSTVQAFNDNQKAKQFQCLTHIANAKKTVFYKKSVFLTYFN